MTWRSANGARRFRVARPDRTELAAEVFGAPDHPLVMLVAGAECSMDWWRPEFCAALAARGRRVVRYDQRGTGATRLGPPGERRIGLPVAVEDALAVLDAAGAADAHWVGFSAGGWAAQLIALDHPDRVSGLTLVSTTPAIDGSDPDLPGPEMRLQRAWADPPPEPDWNDEAAVVEYRVAIDRAYAGDEFDETHDRAIWADSVHRSPTMTREEDGTGVFEDAPRWRERLRSLRTPTAVVHGTADPMFPVANGEALARDIPGARFVGLPGIGHEFPPQAWAPVIDAAAGQRAHFE